MYDVYIQNLSVYYNSVCALKDINLKVKNKEFIGIIGPNGGGKTTLLKVLLKLIKPTSGSIFIDQEKSIGYVPQSTFFDKRFPINVLDVILMGKLEQKIQFYKKFAIDDKKHADEIMSNLGILELKHRQIGQLSGGQLQKVLIARALISNPKILILDEPTASLDSKTKKDIYDILKKLKKEKTILMVTHDTEDIFSCIDNIAYVNKTLNYYKNTSLLNHENLKNNPIRFSINNNEKKVSYKENNVNDRDTI